MEQGSSGSLHVWLTVSDVILECSDDELESLDLTNQHGTITCRQNENAFVDDANIIVESTSILLIDKLDTVFKNMSGSCMRLEANLP